MSFIENDDDMDYASGDDMDYNIGGDLMSITTEAIAISESNGQ